MRATAFPVLEKRLEYRMVYMFNKITDNIFSNRREWHISKYLENMLNDSCRSNGGEEEEEEEERDKESLDWERHCWCKDIKTSPLPKGMTSCETFVCVFIERTICFFNIIERTIWLINSPKLPISKLYWTPFFIQ